MQNVWEGLVNTQPPASVYTRTFTFPGLHSTNHQAMAPYRAATPCVNTPLCNTPVQRVADP